MAQLLQLVISHIRIVDPHLRVMDTLKTWVRQLCPLASQMNLAMMILIHVQHQQSFQG